MSNHRTHQPALRPSFGLLALACAALSACALTEGEVPPTMTIPELVDSQWQVTRLGDASLPDKPLTISFAADNRSFGYAGCNRFFGQYTQQGETLQLSHIGSTRMSCAPEHNKLEQHYLRGLLEVRTLVPREQGIGLLNALGETLMELSPVPATLP